MLDGALRAPSLPRPSLSEGESLVLDPARLRRVQYARLVRKGSHEVTRAHAIDVGVLMQSRAPAPEGVCWGASAGYGMDFEHFRVALRLAACHAQFENELVRGDTNEYDGSLAGLYPWNLRHVTLAAGVAAGTVVMQQSFATLGRAPTRVSAAPYLAFVANASVDLRGPAFLRLDLRAATELAREQATANDDAKLEAVLALRAALLVGIYLTPTDP